MSDADIMIRLKAFAEDLAELAQECGASYMTVSALLSDDGEWFVVGNYEPKCEGGRSLHEYLGEDDE